MKIEKIANVGGGFGFIIQADSTEMATLGEAILHKAVAAAAETLAQQIVKEKGSDIIARVDLNTILNRAVAETVVRIGNASNDSSRRA